MKYTLFFIFASLLCIPSFSQVKVEDSLRILNENYKKRDSIRVKNLLYYTKYSQLHDDTKTKNLIEEALSISKEINFTEGLSNTYSAYALFYGRKGDFKNSLIYAKKAKTIQDSIHDITGLLITNTAIANVYSQLQQPKKAITILKENLNLIKGKNPRKAAVHFYLARAYQTINDTNNAVFHYNEAKKIAKFNNFDSGVSIANSSIGTIKIQKGAYKKGIEYLEKALIFFTKKKQYANIAHCNSQISIAYSRMDNMDKAMNYNKKSIAIYKKQKALKSLKTAYLHQSNYLTLNNDYKKSIYYLKEYYKIKDSLFSMANVKNINDMQTKYDTEKITLEKEKITLEKEVALEKSAKNKTLLYSTTIAFIFLLISLLFVFKNYKTRKRTELIKTKLEETQKRLVIEKQYRSSELKALKAQMNPHFIFNSLNSIQGLILQQDTDASYDYIVLFANLVRNTLNYSNKEFISIQDELKFLDVYLKLEKLRFGDDFTYTINYEGDKEINVPSLIIQPFVENALLHGLLHKEGNKTLNIHFKYTDQLICTIIDNGIGREKAKEINERQGKNHESFALKAIKQRLEILSVKNNKDAFFITTDLYDNNIPLGTKVVITMPYKNVF